MERLRLAMFLQLLGLSAAQGEPLAELLETELEGRHRYVRYDVANRWLAEPGRCYGFAEPLTVERLVSGEAVMATSRTARSRLKVTSAKNYDRYYQSLLRRGLIAGVRLWPKVWSLELGSIDAFVAERERAGREAVTIAQMQHVLGIPLGTLYNLLSRRDIEDDAFTGEARHTVYKTRRSFVVYLKAFCTIFASPHMTAVEWLDARLASRHALMDIREVMFALGVTSEEVYRLRRVLHCIQVDNDRHFFTRESVERYKADIALKTSE